MGPASWVRRLSIGAIAIRVALIAGRLADAIHRAETRDLRGRLSGVLVPTGLLVVVAVWIAPPKPPGVPILEADLVLLAGCLIVAVLAAIAAARSRDHFGLVMLISFAGYAIALAMALLGAPDVAMITAVVETVMTLLLLGALGPFLRLTGTPPTSERRRAPYIAAFGGAIIAGAVYTVLATPAASSLAGPYFELAASAHGKDVVTVILSDFRGLDTAVEVTVLIVAVAGAVASRRGART